MESNVGDTVDVVVTQMKVAKLSQRGKSFGAEVREVIVGEVQRLQLHQCTERVLVDTIDFVVRYVQLF